MVIILPNILPILLNFDDISYDELNHRKNIYYQERLNRLKHE